MKMLSTKQEAPSTLLPRTALEGSLGPGSVQVWLRISGL